ncbi:tetratricopeptide repeat protein [Sorangium sp. So ce406]|uniref:tetratricopeptide repeat protein n=1 Tax=Sorangium sp. So ce406 TaxID=3133311 RepID=UPI003F5C432F
MTQALALTLEDVATLVALGDAHLARGRVDDAERWARAALEAEPEHPDALVLMRHLLLRRGDVSGAREHAVWAVRTEVSNPDALRRRGRRASRGGALVLQGHLPHRGSLEI